MLYYNNKYDIFRLRSDEDILDARKKVNDLIDKYDLKQKKFKI
jgi:hypothetical protein